jgi:hypothetical protein
MLTKKVRFRQISRGLALIITLFSLMTLAVIGFGLIAVVSSQSRSTVAYSNSQRSYYAARAGLSRGLDLIKKEVEINNFLEYPQIDVTMEDGSSFNVLIEAMPGNDTAVIKKWKVTSEGRFDETRRILTTWVEAESFANFAYLTKEEIAWVPIGGVWQTIPIFWADGETIEGRAHTNGFFSIMGNPVFTDRVTSANESDTYWDSDLQAYNRSGTIISDPGKFYHYNSSYADDYPVCGGGGKLTFSGGAMPIGYPSDVTGLKATANLVFDESYIEIYFFPDGTAEIWHWEPIPPPSGYNDKYDRILLSSRAVAGLEPEPPPSPKPPSSPGSPAPAPAPKPSPTKTWVPKLIPNCDDLIIYNSGTVGIGGSTLKGKVTIISGDCIGFWDNIKYNDENTDMLGLISNYSIDVWRSSSHVGDLEVQASILCLNDGLWIDGFNKGVPRGTLTFFGSVCLAYPGISGLVDSGGNLLTGYKTQFKYDERLKGYAPPGYPPTGNLIITYIEDSGALD